MFTGLENTRFIMVKYLFKVVLVKRRSKWTDCSN